MKKSFRARGAAGLVLVVVLALSLVDSALAITCAANTFSPSASAGSSGCLACPTGTTAAAVPAGDAVTYCEGIAANYYGSAGNVGSAHAAVTAACPFGGTSSAGATAVSGCTPQCGSSPYEAASNTCRCVVNAWGTPLDSNGLAVSAASQGCALCGGNPAVAATVYSTVAATNARPGIEACRTTTRPTSLASTPAIPSTFVWTTSSGTFYLKCPEGTAAAAVPANANANTFCNIIAAGYYGNPGVASSTGAKHAYGATAGTPVFKCPSGTTNAAGTSIKKIEDCYATSLPTSVPTGAGGFWTNGAGGSHANKWYVCKAGTTAASIPANTAANTFCEGIAANYYGTVGDGAHATNTAGNAPPTACTATFTHAKATAAGAIYSDASTTTTTRTACKTSPGYRVTSNAGAASAVEVEKARANKYIAGGTPLATSASGNTGAATETESNCPGNTATDGVTGSSSISDCATTCAVNTFAKGGLNTKCFTCPEGTTAAAASSPSETTFCEGIAVGYYGTVGNAASAHASPTACTATFSDAGSAAGITSLGSTTTTTRTACITKPGYRITSNADVAAVDVTVAQAAAGTYIAGGTALATAASGDTGAAPETVTNCAAGKTSIAGSNEVADCTDCAAGTSSTAGAASCTNCIVGKYSVAGGACTDCPTGTTSGAGDAFCAKIAEGYYGDVGVASTSHAPFVTACTATFSDSGSAAGITSLVSATTTTKTACITKPGYIVTSADDAADGSITVASSPANTYAVGGTALLDSDGAGRAAETAAGCGTGYAAPAGSSALEDCYRTAPAADHFAKAGVNNKYFKCPTGTAAAQPTGTGSNTFCVKIAANYYGTAGTASAHASPIACPYGGTRASAATTDQALTTCQSPNCGAGSVNAGEHSNSGTCTCDQHYYGTPLDANGLTVGTATQGCAACTTFNSLVYTIAAGQADTTIADCKAATKPAGNTIATGGVFTKANTDGWFRCPEGSTSTHVMQGTAGDTGTFTASFCKDIAAGYYGTVGVTDGTGAKHSVVTACTATFSGATAAGITSDASTSTTTKTACETAAGYIITSAEHAADYDITVAQAAANHFFVGATALVTSSALGQGRAPQTATACGTGYSADVGSSAVEDCYRSASAADHFAKSGVNNKYFKCPTGTAATAPTGTGSNTYCEKIAADYYGTVGSSAHATPIACPYGGTRSGASATNKALATCQSPACGATSVNAEASGGTCQCKANYYGTPLDASSLTVGTVTQGCTTCGTGYSATAGSTGIDDCNTATRPGTSSTTVPAGGVYAVAASDKYHKCPVGTTAAAVPANTAANTFCEGIAARYYGTAGDVASAHAVPTACTATFTGATAAGITSGASATTTTKTACETAAGYRITSAAKAADNRITVAQAAAGTYIAGGTALVSHATNPNVGTGAQTATNCVAGKYSAAGAASCTNCLAGKTSAAGATSCTDCAAGKYSAVGAASCTNCAAGKISVAGAASCTNCAAGKTSVAGAASCTDCPTGTTSVAGAASCTSTPSSASSPSLPIASAIAAAAMPLLI